MAPSVAAMEAAIREAQGSEARSGVPIQVESHTAPRQWSGCRAGAASPATMPAPLCGWATLAPCVRKPRSRRGGYGNRSKGIWVGVY